MWPDEMKKCTPLWREAHFEVKMYKAHHVRTHFWIASRGRRKGLCTLSKVSKTFVAFPKTMAGVGLLILVATPKKIEHKLSHKYHEISLAIYFIV